MNHNLKTTVFKILDFLPEKLGTSVYHILQNFSENRNLDKKIKSCEATFDTLQKILIQLDCSLKNKKIIEIGSGWLPIMPYFFVFKGNSKKVYTYDLNNHYQKKTIQNFNSFFEKTYSVPLNTNGANHYDLPDSITYFPNRNVNDSDLPQADIVFSRFVLEHVTPEDLLKMHIHFKKNLPKDTLIIHFISPSDHRAYSDKSLSLQDFLKYSSEEWNAIQTRFDYHNRWRLPHYLALFNSLEYSIEYLSHDNPKIDSIQFDSFKKLKIHKDFSNFTDTELTAGNIIIVLKT